MIIKAKDSKYKEAGPMKINEYNINKNFSGALIKMNGNHGKVKCIAEDRIYFVVDGKGKFVIDEKEHDVGKHDVVFVPKNTPYNIIGKMTYFIICSPAFDPSHDIYLK